MVDNYFADGVLPYAEVECLLIYNGYHDTQVSLRKVSDPQIPGTVTFTSIVLWDAESRTFFWGQFLIVSKPTFEILTEKKLKKGEGVKTAYLL